MPRQEWLEFPERPRMFARCQQPLDPIPLRLDPELVQAGRLGEQRRLIRQVGQRRPPPERQGILDRVDRDARIDREGLLRVGDERIEPSRVELERFDDEEVAGRPAFQASVAQRLAEVRHVGLEDVARLLGRLLTPDIVDQDVSGDDLVRADQQVRQDRALLRPSEGDRAVPRVDLERSQDAELHRATVHRASIHAQRRGCRTTLKNRPKRHLCRPCAASGRTLSTTDEDRLLALIGRVDEEGGGDGQAHR